MSPCERGLGKWQGPVGTSGGQKILELEKKVKWDGAAGRRLCGCEKPAARSHRSRGIQRQVSTPPLRTRGGSQTGGDSVGGYSEVAPGLPDHEKAEEGASVGGSGGESSAPPRARGHGARGLSPCHQKSCVLAAAATVAAGG